MEDKCCDTCGYHLGCGACSVSLEYECADGGYESWKEIDHNVEEISMNDIDTGLISYEVHYFDSNKIGFARSSDIPWIYSCGDDKDEAITHAKELIEEGYTKVKVIKRSIAFEEISF